jgi:predicted PurR-regulated permease PerM
VAVSGVLGLFIGPVVLAVTWTRVASRIAELDEPAPGQGTS